jgi:hypothetical protein
MYKVYDEMACAVILETPDKKLAHDEAYNHQCILMLNGKVIKDFSC